MHLNQASFGRRKFLWIARAVLAVLAVAGPTVLAGEESHGKEKWVASWAASAHGPYPSGNPVAQPGLAFAFGSPTVGANDQTFRLILRPDLWGTKFRLRFSNVFGVKPLIIDDIHVGLDRDNRRKTVNAFIRSAVIFEGMADMDAATVNPATGMMRDEFLVNSTLGTIDHLHPNRAGYLSMARTIDIGVLAPPLRGNADD